MDNNTTTVTAEGKSSVPPHMFDPLSTLSGVIGGLKGRGSRSGIGSLVGNGTRNLER